MPAVAVRACSTDKPHLPVSAMVLLGSLARCAMRQSSCEACAAAWSGKHARACTHDPAQAIVDKSAVVASAVLVSALHLLGSNAEIVKRWSNEIQEAVQSKHAMVQFHAVALLHALRAADRLAVSKLVTSLTRGAVRSPLAQCLLVRCGLGGRSAWSRLHAARLPSLPCDAALHGKAGCQAATVIDRGEDARM